MGDLSTGPDPFHRWADRPRLERTRSTAVFRKLLVCALLATSNLNAEIVSTSGAVEVISPPASLANNALASDTFARIFLESQGVLSSAVIVDSNATGGYLPLLTEANAPGAVLPAGTPYQSYLLHIDPVGGARTFVGSITFDAPVIGFVFTELDGYPTLSRLSDTDPVFGNPATSYSGFSFRALAGEGDGFGLSADRRIVTFDCFSFGAQDELRIITAQPAIQSVPNLITELSNPALGLSSGAIHSLSVQLQAALASIQRGDSIPARNQLAAFIRQVLALRNSYRLSAQNAALLIVQANSITGSI